MNISNSLLILFKSTCMFSLTYLFISQPYHIKGVWAREVVDVFVALLTVTLQCYCSFLCCCREGASSFDCDLLGSPAPDPARALAGFFFIFFFLRRCCCELELDAARWLLFNEALLSEAAITFLSLLLTSSFSFTSSNISSSASPASSISF